MVERGVRFIYGEGAVVSDEGFLASETYPAQLAGDELTLDS